MARILLVEVDDDIRTLLILVLENLGHEVTAMASVASAWDREVLDQDFDLYLLGATYGDSSVLRFCYGLHIVYPERPVLVLSAGVRASDKQEALNAGAAAYLTKPVNIAQLEHTVDNLLGEDSENTPAKA